MIEVDLIRQISEIYELAGFRPIETRAVEPVEVLLAKGATDQEIFAVGRIHDDGPLSAAKIGLHFDLTVPFARYVIENQSALQFPFRRYQVQKVWRGERPQKGRYREFYQIDADIVARDELPVAVDGELLALLAVATASLPVPLIELRVSNRKLAEGFVRSLGCADVAAVLSVLDRAPKLGAVGTQVALQELGLSEAAGERAAAFIALRGSGPAFFDRLAGLGVDDDLYRQGSEELRDALDAATTLGAENTIADLGILRGFNYYTGTVVEGFVVDAPDLGAVCSGGRYDDLASGSGARFPGMGVSIGLSRLMAYIVDAGAVSVSRGTPTCVLVGLSSESDRVEAFKVVRSLRSRGVPAECYYSPKRMNRQISYATALEIPYFWFLPNSSETGTHAVRDLRTSQQVPATPDTWVPPSADLHPTIVGSSPVG